MQLPALTVPGVRELLEQAGSALDVGEVYQRTGGNPFYVTEVLAAGSGQVPATVRDAVLARVSALSPAGGTWLPRLRSSVGAPGWTFSPGWRGSRWQRLMSACTAASWWPAVMVWGSGTTWLGWPSSGPFHRPNAPVSMPRRWRS